MVDSVVVISEWDGSHRVIVPPALVEEVIDEAHQGVGTAHEGANKVFHRLLPSYFWPGMKRDIRLQLATCEACDKFHNHSKRQRAALNPIPTRMRGDILAIDVFGG